MDNYIVYDETGDDGINTASSDSFILTAVHMNTKNGKSISIESKTLESI